MRKPPPLGSINCFSISPAKFGRKRFIFDGTTRGLVRAAYEQGARAGDMIQADYGLGFRTFMLTAAPHDPRAFGLWAECTAPAKESRK